MACAPFSGTSFDLLSGEFIRITEGRPIAGTVEPQKKDQRAVTAYQELVAAAERLLKKCRAAEGLANSLLKKVTEEIEKLIDKL